MCQGKCPARGSGGERKPAGKCTGQEQMPRPRGRGGRTGCLRRGRLFSPLPIVWAAGGQRHPHCPAQPAAAASRGAGAAESGFSARALPGVIFAARGFLFIISEAGQNAKAEGRKRPPSAPRRKKDKAALPAAPSPPDCRRKRAACPPTRPPQRGKTRVGRWALSGRKKQGLDKQRKRGYSKYTPPRGRGVRRF